MSHAAGRHFKADTVPLPIGPVPHLSHLKFQLECDADFDVEV